MAINALAIDDVLIDSRRMTWARSGDAVAAWEVLVLLGIGAAAALASGLSRLDLGIPGSSILLNVFPMAFGLALVPRRGAGTLMSTAALAVAVLMSALAVGSRGPGALTSLVATGFLLDLALRRARGGPRLYAAFILAGVTSNLGAFLARGVFKAASLGGSFFEALRVQTWLGKALLTYPLCGAAAGLLSALVWFRFARREREG